MPRELSAAQARQVLARVHGFDHSDFSSGKNGTLDYFGRHECVQVDPIDVAGRNADLTLQSRVYGYRRHHLSDLLYRERRLFEYYCKMLSIMPIELFPIFKYQMEAYSNEKPVRSFFRKYKSETKHILRELERGAVNSRDIVDMGRMKSGWGHNTKVSNMILARLWVSGRVMILNREGGVRTYCLSEGILPKHVVNADSPAKGQDRIRMAKIIVNASRLVTATGSTEQWWFVGKASDVRGILEGLERDGEVFGVRVDGSKETFYAPSGDRDVWEAPPENGEDYVRFIAPLDPLLWSRRVFAMVYGREYSWEIYKKAEHRRYGYYTLPVLFNGEYVGLIEPYFRKADRVLEIRSFHVLDGEVSRGRLLSTLREELERFCSYLNARRTEARKCPLWVKQALTVTA